MKQLNPLKKKRIFWLGMHQLLVTTELKRLRMLGYEVFNPPYLSHIIDQSAQYNWTPPSDSTLPQEAFAILSSTNFFYTAIPQATAEILNHYFGTVIVTINPDWLKSILQVYHGKIIYRTYGQTYRLSEYLTDHRILDLITEREDFWFCPHHEATLLSEDPWLGSLKARIIPYCLSDDVIALQDTWEFNMSKYKQIGLMCPRALDNVYYGHYYKIIKQYFSDAQFKIFGRQVVTTPDSQIVGTLNRKDFLAYFLSLSGFIYHYVEPSLCYLLPIEFMTLGGPVIFQKGSLLSKYFKNMPAPGEAKDTVALSLIAQQLKKGNYNLTNEIIDSQKETRRLYHPSYVWPIFDKAITEIIEADIPTSAPNILYTHPKKNKLRKVDPSSKKVILVPFHNLGSNIERAQGGDYYSTEGIIRVTRLMIKTLTQHNTVIITSYRDDFGKVHGFFIQCIEDYTKLKILILESENTFLRKIRIKAKYLLRKVHNKTYFILKKILNKKSYILNRILNKKSYILNRIRNKKSYILNRIRNKKNYILNKPIIKKMALNLSFINKLFTNKIFFNSYVKMINQDKTISQIMIPHYYLFPEIQAATKSMLLYLPDYLPHFYKDSLDMGSHWGWHYIGKKLANKAKLILTNSEFTSNYLPNSALKVEKEKIVSFPLPYLNPIQKGSDNTGIKEFIKDLPPFFIFYPTRNRPSKRIDDFSKIVSIVNDRLKTSGEKKRIYGILTTQFVPRVSNKYLISLSTLSDQNLKEAYECAVALLFTSENEGNFPTQINEALHLNTPVIATNIPQITNELGEAAHYLQLIDVGDCEKFADIVLYTIDNREKILHIQKKAREHVIKHFSYEQFSTNILAVFSKNFIN